MSNKNRLFEIFRKVNPTVLNEQELDNVEDLVIDVKKDIMWQLKQDPKIFNTGIPHILQLNIQGHNIILQLDGDKPLSYRGTVDTQFNYIALYNFKVNGAEFELEIPIIVNVNKVSDGRDMKFKNDIWFDNMNIDVTKK